TGAIVGALLALLIVVVIDVIKPDTIWTQTTVLSTTDQGAGINGTKEYATATGFEVGMFVRLLTWIGLPALLLLFIVFLSAVFHSPRQLQSPRRELLLVLLCAVFVPRVLVIFERRSFVSESTAQPVAADPTERAEHANGAYDNTPLWLAWGVWLVLVGIVIA